ncbi:MAG: hypothetical protein GY751_16705 [Bacteroidetes bacterium]|nr:hypothetical protein [Bacteroidota bacterium]
MNFFHIIRAKYKINKKFKKELGYPLNLKNPKSYCEKIQWLKFNHYFCNDKVITCADKYAVRTFIKEKGFENLLIELYGCWDKPEIIDWKQLPSRFVIKLNNASGSRYRWLIKDKSKLDIPNIVDEIRRRMSHRYGWK